MGVKAIQIDKILIRQRTQQKRLMEIAEHLQLSLVTALKGLPWLGTWLRVWRFCNIDLLGTTFVSALYDRASWCRELWSAEVYPRRSRDMLRSVLRLGSRRVPWLKSFAWAQVQIWALAHNYLWLGLRWGHVIVPYCYILSQVYPMWELVLIRVFIFLMLQPS